MTLNQLIAELTKWAEDRGELEVAVVTPAEDEGGPIGDDATVLSVGCGPQSNVVLVVG